jgi:hypothetical protein
MRDRKSRADAPISIDSPTSPKIEGLDGGAGWIRTPGAATAYLGGIRPEFGALLRANKSIRAGENLFRPGFGPASDLSGSLRSPG